jgi:hypothetical protein
MRVFGDLNGPEYTPPRDPLGSGAQGEKRSLEDENLSYAAGEESMPKGEQEVKSGDPIASGREEPEHDPRRVSAGGVLPADPTARPVTGPPPGQLLLEPIDELPLKATRDTYTPAPRSAHRTNGEGWFFLLGLTLALLAAGAYSYFSLRNNHIRLAQVPEFLRSLTTMGGRMDSTEAKLRDLTDKWGGLSNHLAELDRKFDSGQRATRNQVRELVGQASRHLQAEMDQRGEVVDARLSNVESKQTQDRAQLEQLNSQLRDQISSLRQQLTLVQEGAGRDLANMQEQVSNNAGDLHTLTQSLHRDRMTFELVKNAPTELAPGVTLTILKTDVGYQRFKGYVFLSKDGKTLWLNNFSAKEAVDLYSQQYSHPYSLVVTAVSDDGVAGYLLLPAGA